ncbi:MAG: D-isomer specific 2-hydroxyacid dehydrogenase family protein [Actinomycetota bacterium]
MTRRVAVEPECWRRPALVAAVEAAGATVAPIDEATGLIWADPQNPQLLPEVVHDGLDWVQLPYAGIEPFLHLLDDKREWTCGKGVYARPVAEAALAMLLAGFRHIAAYARETTWSGPVGQNLHGANVLVLGSGGITEELLPLLAPFGCHVTVLRRRAEPMDGASATATLTELDGLLPHADAVILALALTPETEGVIGAEQLALMKPTAWLVNVARGGHVDTDALVTALESGSIGGAALDVTAPEPLPDEHPLWTQPNCLITPHVANTPEMGLILLAERVTANVERYLAHEPLIGLADLTHGY